MCDEINMPDGSTIDSIIDENGEECCLCSLSQDEMFQLIIAKLPELECDERLIIERDCFGMNVSIKKGE